MEKAYLIVQIVSALIYAAALIISIKQIRNDNKLASQQSQNNFFAEYTRRYHDIVLAMPDEFFESVAKPEGKTLKYIQLYFDLCSEEFQLYKTKMIPDDIWENWVEGMAITAEESVYKLSWEKLKKNYNKDFRIFMEKDVLKSENEK